MRVKLITTILNILAEILTEIRRLQGSESEVWRTDDVAKFLKLSKSSVQSRVISRPDFPRAVRIPSENGTGGKRWYAREVKAWLQKNRDPMIKR